MATSPEIVRAQLTIVTTAAAAEVANAAAGVALERQLDTAMAAAELIVPGFYDAAGSLAVAWYDEIRDESNPSTAYSPTIIGDPATDWIEREVESLRADLEGDLEQQMQRLTDELDALVEKEVARGFRDTVLGNARTDQEAIGWSRIARGNACKFCVMLAGKGAVYRSESTATFASHKSCHCAARPAFRNGENGPEASVQQYLASSTRRTPAQRKALRKYLNENYPDNRG